MAVEMIVKSQSWNTGDRASKIYCGEDAGFAQPHWSHPRLLGWALMRPYKFSRMMAPSITHAVELNGFKVWSTPRLPTNSVQVLEG